MTPRAPATSATVHQLRSVPEVSAVLRRDESEFAKGEEVSELFNRRMRDLTEGVALANVSVIELAVLLAFQRFPHASEEAIAAEIAQWTRAPVTADDVKGPILRLLHVGYLVREEEGVDLTADSTKMVTHTLRQMMRLVLRDRYVFDLVKIIDLSYESWSFVHDRPR